MNTNHSDLFKNFTFNDYFSKEEINYRLSNDIVPESFWQEITAYRKQKAQFLPFNDQADQPFWFLAVALLQKTLYDIDSSGKDSLYQVVKKEIEFELVQDSLIEEALYSSVIEGAFSTYKRLKELVVEKQLPTDISDQMVLNNYKAMQFILKEKHRDLSIDFILELHRIITEETLGEDEAYAGKFRDDAVYIKDKRDRIIYTPPPAGQVYGSMQKLVDWTNQKDEAFFIHPVLKASFIHFHLAYMHPFFDGNGRTARALFYYYLIKNGYEFFKYFSISVVVQKTKVQYYKAIKDVEDNEADLTYFFLYMARTIKESINLVTERITKHYQRDFFFDKIKKKGVPLNARQEKFMRKMLVGDGGTMTIKLYQKMNSVVYETARRDLEDLAGKGVLIRSQQGRKFVYWPDYSF